ncbi:MAG: TlpA family protein disulfide reductase [Thermomicrobiales bacterium]
MGALIVVGILVVGIYQWLDGRNDQRDPGDATVGAEAVRPAPEFALSLFDGGTFNLADHRGKVVVVNFWASWCVPCKEEMPELQAVAASPPANVVFVGVDARSDKEADARAFAEKYGVTYAIGRDTVGGDELRGAIEQAYGIPGYPATIVIDPNGDVSAIKIGAITKDELNSYIAKARK